MVCSVCLGSYGATCRATEMSCMQSTNATNDVHPRAHRIQQLLHRQTVITPVGRVWPRSFPQKVSLHSARSPRTGECSAHPYCVFTRERSCWAASVHCFLRPAVRQCPFHRLQGTIESRGRNQSQQLNECKLYDVVNCMPWTKKRLHESCTDRIRKRSGTAVAHTT